MEPQHLIQGFDYDSLGNMTNNSELGSYGYTDPDHIHAVTSAGGKTYEYDANGNMTNVKVSGVIDKTYSWDAENRLTSVDGVSFTYDPSGNRIKKSGSSTYIYFGSMVELVDGQMVKYYYAGSTLVAKQDSTGKYWYHTDHLGSTRLITNDQFTDPSLIVENEYDYAPFGKFTRQLEAVANEEGFTGHKTDADIGLIYMGARYYDATLGRFISADTIVQDPLDPQTLNRYTYTRNNPLSYVDPNGNSFFGIDILIGAAVGALIGGTTAELMGGDFLDGALAGAVTGAIFGGVTSWIDAANAQAFNNMMTSGLGWMDAAAFTAGELAVIYGGAGAAAGALTASMNGTNVLQGAGYGAFSAAANGFGRGYFGQDWGVQRVLYESVAGGISLELKGGDFVTGALNSGGSGLLTYSNWLARKYELGHTPAGSIGKSPGILGLAGKLGGTRPLATTGVTSIGSFFNFGGRQGGPGSLGCKFFGIDYAPGGGLDKLVEAFSGPHDFLNGRAAGMYNSAGEYSGSIFGLRMDNVISALNVPFAAPAAITGLASHYRISIP